MAFVYNLNARYLFGESDNGVDILRSMKNGLIMLGKLETAIRLVDGPNHCASYRVERRSAQILRPGRLRVRV